MLICPRCGKNSKEVKFLDAFCVNCYPFNLQLPKSVKIEMCKRCGKMRVKGEWVEYDRKKLEEYVAGKSRGEFEKVEYDSDSKEMIFTVRKWDESAEIRMPFEFEKMVVICPDCSRIAGGYFESIIQLRGNEKKVEKYSKLLTRMLKDKTFITKSEEMHGGVDMYVGSTREVLGVMSELRLRTKITKKLMGLREGKRYYRTTFAIRFD